MAHEDWDLYAIVRSCKAANTATTTNTETPPSSNSIRSPHGNNTTTTLLEPFTVNGENGSFSFPNLVQPRADGFQELHQLLNNFNPTTITTTSTTTSTSGIGIIPNPTFSNVVGFIGQQLIPQQSHHHFAPPPYTSIGTSTTGFERFHHQQHHQHQPQTPEQQQQQNNQPPLQVAEKSSTLSPNIQTPKSRKRKVQQKKMVCHVAADNLSADLWAWRKYGQKPIKGSPYPRNYYRCSSCKGCAARKQVERSTAEPNMFIVTYTGDHKHAKPVHRSSLAGSTRTKSSSTRLPETQKIESPCHKGTETSSSSALYPMPLRSGSPQNEEGPVSTGQPGCSDPGEEPDSASEYDDDILIPNTTAMSDAVLLGRHHFDGVMTEGSGSNNNIGSTQNFSESVYDNIRVNSG